MKNIKLFEEFNSKVLIIVDVQKNYRKFFTEMYLHELKNYCKQFLEVYQIFDNHVDGKKKEDDYLYLENPPIPVHKDLYQFPNQNDIIEKRYNYDVDVDFYRKVLDENVYNTIKEKESSKTLKKGEFFETKKGTIIVYIGNNHKWFHVPVKLYRILKKLVGREVIIVGGADSECLDDVFTTAESLGINIKRNWNFIYTAAHCPI